MLFMGLSNSIFSRSTKLSIGITLIRVSSPTIISFIDLLME